MIMSRLLALLGPLLLLPLLVAAQPRGELSLLEAFQLLEERYPLLQNAALNQQIYTAELGQLEADRRPTIMAKGRRPHSI